MRVGFTGTQRGLTGAQHQALETCLKNYFPQSFVAQFHHGDCIGADAEAASLARLIGYKIVGHPPTNATRRANFSSDFTYPARPYLERNHAIVSVCELLIGCPGEFIMELRSGTWATLRYAKRVRKTFLIIFPDGEVKDNF